MHLGHAPVAARAVTGLLPEWPVTLTLLDWRRRVAALYAAARAATDPEAGWRQLAGRPRRAVRRAIPTRPLDAAARAAFGGLPFAPVRPRAAVRGRARSRPSRAGWSCRPRPTASSRCDRIGTVSLGRPRPTRRLVARTATAVGCSCRCATAAPARATYGGGRYLLDTVKGADLGGDGDRLVVDLNFAYHPSCTYDPRWSCPLAPEGNRIETPVAAGEQLPPGGWY